jgi:hypothetical protein
MICNSPAAASKLQNRLPLGCANCLGHILLEDQLVCVDPLVLVVDRRDIHLFDIPKRAEVV